MEFQITYGSSFIKGLGFDQFSIHGYYNHSSSSLSSSSSNNSLIKAAVNEIVVVGKQRISQTKTPQALKSHSDAERRRRVRINAHFSTLRALLQPSSSSDHKMDKAAILAEVITQLRKLKKRAIDASTGLLIPLDMDEVLVHPLHIDQTVDETTLRFKVTICCSYRPDLLSDLKMLLNELKLRMEVLEMSTLEGRVKNEFVVSICNDGNGVKIDQNVLAETIQRALTLVLDCPVTGMQNKKRKLL